MVNQNCNDIQIEILASVVQCVASTQCGHRRRRQITAHALWNVARDEGGGERIHMSATQFK